jgi:hypothetical protein
MPAWGYHVFELSDGTEHFQEKSVLKTKKTKK